MAIENYANLAGRLVQTGRGDAVLGQGAVAGQPNVQEPINPPGRWTRFKAALSSLPGIGQLGTLQRARAEIAAYQVKVGQQLVSSRQFLGGFIQDLRESYGPEVANLCFPVGAQGGGTPLSARKVASVIEDANRLQQPIRARNHAALTNFLEGRTRAAGDQSMNRLFAEHFKAPWPNGQFNWQHLVGARAAESIRDYVEKRCMAMPGFRQGVLPEANIVRAAKEAIGLYAQHRNLPPEELAAVFKREAAAEWHKPYPPPGIEDLRDLSRAGCREELIQFARAEFNEENLLLLQAIAAFRENPTWQNAQALRDEFLDARGAHPANVSAAVLQPVIAALTGAAAPPAAPPNPGLFAAMQTEVEHLVMTDMLPRFLKAVQKGDA